MIALALVWLALTGLQQSDIDAAMSMCRAAYTSCKTLQCDTITDVRAYTTCRVNCRKEYQACIEDIQAMLDQG